MVLFRKGNAAAARTFALLALLVTATQHIFSSAAFVNPTELRGGIRSESISRAPAGSSPGSKPHHLDAPRNGVTLDALSSPGADAVAEVLGYLVGAGSLLLYTPIGVRVLRQGSADGLTLSTWWLKLTSYTCTDVYAFSKSYPVSTYAETLVITVEATVILFLVAYYQKRIDARFAVLGLGFVGATVWALTAAPPSALALGQASSTVLNAGALVPQLVLNAERRASGGYSPVTAGLATAGCLIRLFTTVQLAGSDRMLLVNFGIALLLNGALLVQILWLGIVVEKRTFASVMTADLRSADADDASIEEGESILSKHMQ